MDEKRVREIIAAVKPLAVEYYRLTKKPLGVTAEIAELAAATKLRIKLADARTPGYDARRGEEKIQIKGRALDDDRFRNHKLGRIKRNADCDTVMFVLLDKATLEARGIWEASYRDCCKRLNEPGSKGRERGELMIGDFIKLRSARQVWPKGTARPSSKRSA